MDDKSKILPNIELGSDLDKKKINGKSPEAEVEKAEEEVITWVEFTKNTTFHGIKYIFDNKPFSCRRALWFSCVLTCVGVFLYAGLTRLADFRRYSSNVNLKLDYPTSLPFPAVTICNQNNFRLTKAVEYGAYDYLDAFFSRANSSQLNRYVSVNNVNLTQFVLNAAHTRDDFIDRCVWKNDPNCRTMFNMVFTDTGICYTFNATNFGSRMAANDEPGARYGLRLILNVEQYEYMKSDQDDVGVKVLLHSCDTQPQIQDQGFVVEPGKHTMVSISRTKYKALGDPYDKTSKTAPPFANCQLDCLSQRQKKHCNCTSVYMPQNSTDPPTCQIRKQFECILFKKEANSLTKCNCQVPTERINFGQQISTALLSKYNINQMAFSQPNSRKTTKEQFIKAQDTSQRAKQAVREYNDRLIENIWNSTEALQILLMKYLQVFENSTTFIEKYGSVDVLDKTIREDFTSTQNVTGKMFKDREKEFENMHAAPNLYNIIGLLEEFWMRFIQFPVLDLIDECVANGTLDAEMPLHLQPHFYHNMKQNDTSPEKREGHSGQADELTKQFCLLSVSNEKPLHPEKERRPDENQGGTNGGPIQKHENDHQGQVQPPPYGRAKRTVEHALSRRQFTPSSYFPGFPPPWTPPPTPPKHSPHASHTHSPPANSYFPRTSYHASPSYSLRSTSYPNSLSIQSPSLYLSSSYYHSSSYYPSMSFDSSLSYHTSSTYSLGLSFFPNSSYYFSLSNDAGSSYYPSLISSNNPSLSYYPRFTYYPSSSYYPSISYYTSTSYYPTLSYYPSSSYNPSSSHYPNSYYYPSLPYNPSSHYSSSFYYPSSASYRSTFKGPSSFYFSSSYSTDSSTYDLPTQVLYSTTPLATSSLANWVSSFSDLGESAFNPDYGDPKEDITTPKSFSTLPSNFDLSDYSSFPLGDYPGEFSSFPSINYPSEFSTLTSMEYQSDFSSYSSGNYPSDSRSWPMMNSGVFASVHDNEVTENSFTTITDGYYTGDYDGSFSSEFLSDNGGLDEDGSDISWCSEGENCSGGTCIKTKIPELEQITMAAIDPRCITIYTASSSYTLAQKDESLYYYDVNGNNDGWFQAREPRPPPFDDGPNNPNSNPENPPWMINNKTDGVPRPIPPFSFSPNVTYQCDNVKDVLCSKRQSPPPENLMVTVGRNEVQVKPSLRVIFDGMEKVQHANSIQEIITALRPLQGSSIDVKQMLNQTSSMNLEDCMWYKKYWVSGQAEVDIKQYMSQPTQANIILSSVNTDITYLKTTLRNFKATLDMKIVPYFRQLLLFINGTIEKSELVDKYDSFQVKVALTKLSSILDDYEARARTWDQNMFLADSYLSIWYKSIAAMLVPIITRENVDILPVTKAVKGVHAMKELMDQVQLDPRNAKLIPSLVIQPLQKPPKDGGLEISKALDDLITAEENLRDDLDTYAKGNKMDDAFFMENFLQLDLYYPELSYMTIEYQEAFTFVSLLSEIGGFMGLLLGASVLTICEIVDFIFLQCASAWGHKAKKYKR